MEPHHWTRIGPPAVCNPALRCSVKYLYLSLTRHYQLSLLALTTGCNDADELEAIVETIFDAVHNLYVKAGARNFVLIDVPPIHRSPQGATIRDSHSFSGT